jgi:hypothetical protein
MKVGCPSCGQTVAGADIDLAAGQALCRPCGELFPLATAPSSDTLVPSTAAPVTLYRPIDLQLREARDEGGVRLSLRPVAGSTVALVVGSVFFFGTSLWLLSQLVRSPIYRIGPGLVMLAFFLFLASATLYGALQPLLPYRIRLDRNGLLVRGPLGRRRLGLPPSSLRRFVPAEPRAAATRSGVPNLTHGVRVLTEDGQSIDLTLAFESRLHADYVTQRLNQILDEARPALPATEEQ